MPPPHLHPRSRMTSSLFATTVLASFLVVGLPHVLPCPAPRVVYADGEMADGTVKRRRRKRPENADAKDDGLIQFQSSIGDHDEATNARASKRECPVPKPSGKLGDLLGFKKVNDDESRSRPDAR
ncbi:hypothetical protein B0H63DRAFT_114740 [Podospora didyma]|uniref:Alpha-1,3-mannosyltransferase n=1 Tax=Podospora didyma TaxID=330526 RepID=A0AAE0NZ98_9PEZI|nr:hypothetical protein B0H63DRAFT_114740 [Podospora didyma]